MDLFGTVILFLGAKVIATKWIEIPEAVYCLIALSPSIFFVSITSVLRGYFNGREDLTLTAKSQGVEQVAKTIFTIVLVEIVARISKNNIALMAGVANLATTIATFVSFSYIYLYYRSKRNEIGIQINQSVNYVPTRIRKTLKKILKESVPISLSSLMSSFNKNIDLFTVVRGLKCFMPEKEAIAQYGILSGKVDTICLLPLSLNIPFVTAIVPSIAKEKAKGNEIEVKSKIIKYMKVSCLIGLISTIGLCIFAKIILKIIFPNASNGTVLLQINSISILFAVIAQTLNGILQGIGKTNIPAIAFLIGMILKLIINIFFVKLPYIGINAAAIGNIICNLAVCIIDGIILCRCIKFNFFQKNK